MASDNDKNLQSQAELPDACLHKQSNRFVQKFIDKYIKKKVDYFDIFVNGVSISIDAAKSIKIAIADGEINNKELLHIKEIKHTGSIYVNESLKIVEDAFITPIDQRDIIEIIKGIESILHSIESIANHIYIMRIAKSDEFMAYFVEIIISLCQKLNDLMVTFKQFKKNPKENINNLITEINELEEEGDRTYSECMLHIFGVETDTINIMKKKEIYQRLEYSLDCFKRVADMVEKIIVATM